MTLRWIGGALLSAAFALGTAAQERGGWAAVRGRVIDAQTGEALGKVRVAVPEARRETSTNDEGRFEITQLAPGPVHVHVSTVGYGVEERRLVLSAGTTAVLEVALGPATIRRSEAVLVAVDAFAPVESSTGTEYTLSASELKNLAGVVADDPLRSVHSLPGVAADDDFHATFARRGLGFAAVGFYIDGVLTTAPFHTVRADEESLGGSITILSGDLVESLSLMSGAPVRYGDRIGPVLAVRTRAGAERFTSRLNVSLAGGVSATLEGPWPGSNRGSWLASARKSYLGYLTRRVADDTPLLDYYDLQAKLTYRVSSTHQLSLFALHGDFNTERRDVVARARRDLETEAHTRTSLGCLRWDWLLGGKASLATSVFGTTEDGERRNRLGEDIARQESTQAGLRADLAYPLGRHHRLDAGLLWRQLDEAQDLLGLPIEAESLEVVAGYDAASAQPGGYLQHTWTMAGEHLTVTSGLRMDALGASGETLWLPRLAATLKLGGRTTLAAHAGEHAQFARFVQLLGPAGNPSLRAERSRHGGVSVERVLGPRVRLRVEAYEERVRGGLFSGRRESRVLGDYLAPADELALLRNTLVGESRGVEVLLQRRSANGLSGWASYAWGRARYREGHGQPAFDADFDQRHTINVYASARLSRSVHASTKYRYGSGFPLVGFYRREGAGIMLAGERNEVRRKGYSRWDVRLNKAIGLRRGTLTLYAEVMNVLNQKNVRVDHIVENFATRAVVVEEQRLFPILPAVGLTVEF